MSEIASARFETDIEPATASRSFWRKLGFARLNFVGNLAAKSVASEQGGSAPFALPGSRIVIREIASGKEVWQTAVSDVKSGRSPEQLLDDIQRDLEELPLEQFVAKWGITDLS